MADTAKVKEFVEETWYKDCVPKLKEYIEIPNLSPYFTSDANKDEARENQDKAMKLIKEWVEAQDLQGADLKLYEEEGRTPLLFVEVAATEGVDVEESGTVLLYGHMDKQPPFTGWEEGLEPYKAVEKDGKLYGRGGADDGYSVFCAVTALRALQKQGCPHGRCVIIVEACEESGSPDLPFYIEKLKDQIGSPNLIVCLDSGCGNYEQLWITTSLRGVVVGKLTVEHTTEGVHSGDASGIIPDTFRIARQVLDRFEDAKTGKILMPELNVEVPEKYQEQVATCAQVLGKAGLIDCFPFLEGAQPTTTEEGKDQLTELALNRWWRPQLSYVGASGLPSADSAGNVLRPSTTLALSCRLPPTLETEGVQDAMRKCFESDPPYGSKISFVSEKIGGGWAAPVVAPWLENAAHAASKAYYGKEAVYMGEGGSIPFMGMLGKMFPQAQFLIIGVLGPGSNAHGPNEFLHLDFSAKLTCCVASVVGDHCKSKVEAMLKSSDSGEPAAKKAKVEELNENFGRNPDGTKL